MSLKMRSLEENHTSWMVHRIQYPLKLKVCIVFIKNVTFHFHISESVEFERSYLSPECKLNLNFYITLKKSDHFKKCVSDSSHNETNITVMKIQYIAFAMIFDKMLVIEYIIRHSTLSLSNSMDIVHIHNLKILSTTIYG